MQITNNLNGSGIKVNLTKDISSESANEALIKIDDSSGSGVKVNLIKGVSSKAIAEALTRINEQELNIIGYESQTKTYRDETSVLRDNTQVSANNANVSATNANNSALLSTAKANEAILSANNALTYRNEAETFKTNAKDSEINADLRATAASTSEVNAKSSELLALQYKDTTLSLKNETLLLKNETVLNAITATEQATSSTSNAIIAEQQAQIATTKASESLVNASNAKASELLSAQYKADNENIKTNVQTLSNSAYDSANTASIKANEAIDSAIISTTQANISIAKASEASTYATNSNTSSVNALASENKAEEWASKGYGLEVEPGLYSAKHYAIEANNSISKVVSVNGMIGDVVLTKSNIGLENIDNTSDINKPISTATQTALNSKANAANAALTGVPTAPTAEVGTNTTQLATTAYVKAAITDSTPTKTGTGASGTWGINITGNASTANNAALATNATKLATARFINGVAFDGTSDITVADSTKAPLNGTGATGTWNINITGNAATTGGLGVSTDRNNVANKIVKTDASGYIQAGYINSSNGNEKNNTNCAYVWGTNGSDDYLRTYNTSYLNVASATNATFQIASSGATCDAKFKNTPAHGTSFSEANGVADAPNTGWWMIYSIRHSNYNNYWGTQIAYGWEDNANAMYQRNIVAGTWSGWTRVDVSGANITELANDAGFITSSGRAYPRRSDGADLNFYWSGQGGQPTWLWGGNDGANMYVYNPSNFSVNYANSAGSVSASAVASGTAGIAVGAVGSYAFIKNISSSNIVPGGTLAGSSLRYGHGGEFYVITTPPTGTWRVMGSGYYGYTSLWLRIA